MLAAIVCVWSAVGVGLFAAAVRGTRNVELGDSTTAGVFDPKMSDAQRQAWKKWIADKPDAHFVLVRRGGEYPQWYGSAVSLFPNRLEIPDSPLGGDPRNGYDRHPACFRQHTAREAGASADWTSGKPWAMCVAVVRLNRPDPQIVAWHVDGREVKSAPSAEARRTLFQFFGELADRVAR